MNTVTVINYKTDTGQEPFDNWLLGLDRDERAIIRTRVSRVRLGNFGDCHPIAGTKGIFELRLHHGPGYRVYFGKKGNTIIILLIGGIKRTQSRDIEKAKHYWDNYKEIKP